MIKYLTKKERINATNAWRAERIKAGASCERCGRTTELTADHIIPQHWLVQFGYDVERMFDPTNLRILCRMCNEFKGGRLDPADNKTYDLIKEYVENLKR